MAMLKKRRGGPCMVPGSWFLILGPWFLVPAGPWFLLGPWSLHGASSLCLGPWSLHGPWSCMVLGPWSFVPVLVPGPWSLVPGPWSLVLVPGPWFLVLGPWSLHGTKFAIFVLAMLGRLGHVKKTSRWSVLSHMVSSQHSIT